MGQGIDLLRKSGLNVVMADKKRGQAVSANHFWIDGFKQGVFRHGPDIHVDVFGMSNALEKEAEIAPAFQGKKPLVHPPAELMQKQQVKDFNRLSFAT